MGTNGTVRSERQTRDLAAVDGRLREVLEPLRSRLHATKDGPDGLSLEIPGLEGKPWGYVAGIRHGKRYVSLYLMSVYALPDLLQSMSPELRRRMQGKSCFNFTTVDERLFAELAEITRTGLDRYLALAAEAGARVLGPQLERENGMAVPTSVEEYLAALPEEPRVALEALRKTIRATAPEATETIAYLMPAFMDNGRFLVSYAAFKDHCSLFPASQAVMDALGDELKPYFSGKGTIRFQPDASLPAALVKRIVEVRIREIAARSGR